VILQWKNAQINPPIYRHQLQQYLMKFNDTQINQNSSHMISSHKREGSRVINTVVVGFDKLYKEQL